MANPLNGEVTLTIEMRGEAKESSVLARFDGRTFVLKYSSNALVQVENELNLGVMDIGAELLSWKINPRRIRFGFVRALLWACLRDSHPEIDIRTAGDLLVAAGGIATVLPKINEAITIAFPQAETKGSRPPSRAERRRKKAAHGIGSPS